MSHKDPTDQSPAESSAVIRQRVNRACSVQQYRLTPLVCTPTVRCKLETKGDQLLEQVTGKRGLSARSFTRILKLARTIADLAGVEQIETLHLAEAIQYRGVDRKLG